MKNIKIKIKKATIKDLNSFWRLFSQSVKNQFPHYRDINWLVIFLKIILAPMTGFFIKQFKNRDINLKGVIHISCLYQYAIIKIWYE